MTTATWNGLDKALSTRRPALICYLPLGDPAARFADPAAYLADGVDVLEVGVAAPAPMLDGPIIRDSMRRALAAGMNNKRAAREIAAMKLALGDPATVWMTYPSAAGPDFREDLRASGTDGVLVAGAGALTYSDIPGVHEIQFIPHRPTAGQVAAAAHATGYIMVAAANGVSGRRGAVSPDNADLLQRLRENGATARLALGFGITDWRGARDAVRCGADAIIVGTAALLAAMDSARSLRRLISTLRNALDE